MVEVGTMVSSRKKVSINRKRVNLHILKMAASETFNVLLRFNG